MEAELRKRGRKKKLNLKLLFVRGGGNPLRHGPSENQRTPTEQKTARRPSANSCKNTMQRTAPMPEEGRSKTESTSDCQIREGAKKRHAGTATNQVTRKGKNTQAVITEALQSKKRLPGSRTPDEATIARKRRGRSAKTRANVLIPRSASVLQTISTKKVTTKKK